MEKPTSQTRIPPEWLGQEKYSTKTEMIKARKSQSIPDISFDLDGDGVVGGHDLVVSSRFDHDKDGKLNQSEREEALKALSEGYSSQYIWGCESSGLNRSFRLVQKRGKVIDNEEFNSIQETYPIPPSESQNKQTRSTLNHLRREKDKQEAKKNEERMKTVTSKTLPIDSFLSKDRFIENPAYSSISQKKENEKKMFRVQAGLTQVSEDVISSGSVRFSYENQPKHLSLTEMRVKQRENLINQLNSSADYSHLTFYSKVEKEKSYVSPPGKILRDVLGERRDKDIQHLEKTFTHHVQGIHGKELPKFENNLESFKDLSPYVSNNQFYNPFENLHHLKLTPKLEEITIKPTQAPYEYIETIQKNRISSKFTDYYSQFMPHGGRSQEIYKERMKLAKIHQAEKKQFRFFAINELTPPITQRLMLKSSSPHSKYKSITSTGFNFK
jgi:hypothetical protein